MKIQMIVFVSYTTTESTIQKICSCKREKKSTREPVPGSKKMQPPPSPPSLSLTLSIKLCLPCLAAFTTRQYSGQEQLSDRLTGQIVGPIASSSGDASPPLYFSLPSCPLGRVQSPHPGNMGPGGCSRQLFGNDTMREFIGKAVSACGWGGDDAAHVVLAMCAARCAAVNHGRSQSDAPLILLSITIFIPMISDSTKNYFLFVPFLLLFIWCPYEGL